jgi:hypothetical protein
MGNSKVKLSGESYFRFRNRWPRVEQVTPESFPTFSDGNGSRVERQLSEAISPQVIVLPLGTQGNL